MKGIYGKKLGMTQIFDATGKAIPITVIAAGPCVVTRVKTQENDGYQAIQIAFGAIKAKRVNKPIGGFYKKVDVKPHRYLKEIRMDNISEYKVGQEIKVNIFSSGEHVDVVGKSKGKGFAGGMKRWNFSGGPSSHGSMIHRQPASSGSTDAARTIKGTKKPGRLGGVRVTAQHIEVIKVDNEKNLLMVKGAIPGPPNTLLYVRKSVKTKPPKKVVESVKDSAGKKK